MINCFLAFGGAGRHEGEMKQHGNTAIESARECRCFDASTDPATIDVTTITIM